MGGGLVDMVEAWMGLGGAICAVARAYPGGDQRKGRLPEHIMDLIFVINMRHTGTPPKANHSGGFHIPDSKNATSAWGMNETLCLNGEFYFTVSKANQCN
jgi:hypothetical protein